MSEFDQKKAEEQGVKDSLAQQEALGKLGITREFKAESSDHTKLYNWSPWRPQCWSP
jgi:hypothetical protein